MDTFDFNLSDEELDSDQLIIKLKISSRKYNLILNNIYNKFKDEDDSVTINLHDLGDYAKSPNKNTKNYLNNENDNELININSDCNSVIEIIDGEYDYDYSDAMQLYQIKDEDVIDESIYIKDEFYNKVKNILKLSVYDPLNRSLSIIEPVARSLSFSNMYTSSKYLSNEEFYQHYNTNSLLPMPYLKKRKSNSPSFSRKKRPCTNNTTYLANTITDVDTNIARYSDNFYENSANNPLDYTYTKISTPASLNDTYTKCIPSNNIVCIYKSNKSKHISKLDRTYECNSPENTNTDKNIKKNLTIDRILYNNISPINIISTKRIRQERYSIKEFQSFTTTLLAKNNICFPHTLYKENYALKEMQIKVIDINNSKIEQIRHKPHAYNEHIIVYLKSNKRTFKICNTKDKELLSLTGNKHFNANANLNCVIPWTTTFIHSAAKQTSFITGGHRRFRFLRNRIIVLFNVIK